MLMEGAPEEGTLEDACHSVYPNLERLPTLFFLISQQSLLPHLSTRSSSASINTLLFRIYQHSPLPHLSTLSSSSSINALFFPHLSTVSFSASVNSLFFLICQHSLLPRLSTPGSSPPLNTLFYHDLQCMLLRLPDLHVDESHVALSFNSINLASLVSTESAKPEQQVEEAKEIYQDRLDSWNRKQQVAKRAITGTLDQTGRNWLSDCATAPLAAPGAARWKNPPPRSWHQH
ncbi:hypothetical protein EJ06DRAFT_129035 [Trichodelitschia bisporula]|uniref:Uncharacterized protein n=1 Tax=Trichodelitschia bisporula TaxID=703511 RepID=A0A6G1HNZ9_9PEZI|nr:hypothetical protein EJ06DRAFT_129035 [Trichodelitschia bisporula]